MRSNLIEKLRYLLFFAFIAFFIISISLFLISTISGFILCDYTSQYYTLNGKPIKCLNYIFEGYKGAYDWAVTQSSKIQDDLEKWHSEMLKKAFGKNNKATNYYCGEVVIPILIFSELPYVLMINITIFLAFNSCYSPVKNSYPE